MCRRHFLPSFRHGFYYTYVCNLLCIIIVSVKKTPDHGKQMTINMALNVITHISIISHVYTLHTQATAAHPSKYIEIYQIQFAPSALIVFV